MTFTGIQQVEHLIDLALSEDIGQGDITTEALISDEQQRKAFIVIKEKGTLAGTEIAKQVFLKVDHELKIDILIKDGANVKPGDIIAQIEGKLASILKAERTALNFLQHLSGIASETAFYVDAVKDMPAQITDTRKTTPGLRILEKYAVRTGGGRNHRTHLGNGILIKDNHMAALNSQGLGTMDIIARVRQNVPAGVKIEVEVKTPQEAADAADAGADIIMLDNMSINDMRRSVQLVKGRAIIEASGGINLEKVRAVAETGVDIISIGALTHSPKALDISLKLD